MIHFPVDPVQHHFPFVTINLLCGVQSLWWWWCWWYDQNGSSSYCYFICSKDVIVSTKFCTWMDQQVQKLLIGSLFLELDENISDCSHEVYLPSPGIKQSKPHPVSAKISGYGCLELFCFSYPYVFEVIFL